MSRLLFLIVAIPLFGCASFPAFDAQYAQIYVRALDPSAQVDVGARIYLADSGQVLTTHLTPTAVPLVRSSSWYPGKIVSLVIDAPGYEAAVRLVSIDRWGSTPEQAALNANNVDVIMVPEGRPSRQSRIERRK